MEFDAYARTYAGHGRWRSTGASFAGTLAGRDKPVGLLAATGRAIEAGTLDTLGEVVAIAIERAQFLGDLKRRK